MTPPDYSSPIVNNAGMNALLYGQQVEGFPCGSVGHWSLQEGMSISRDLIRLGVVQEQSRWSRFDRGRRERRGHGSNPRS
jgi:hypothetical protein